MPTATLETLEQRLTAMEQEIARLKQRFDAENPPITGEQGRNGWVRLPDGSRKGSLGLFEDEPEMVDEMMALIRAERDKSAHLQAYDIE